MVVRPVAAAVGLLTAAIEVDVASDDPAVAGVSLAPPTRLPPASHAGSGVGPLWREWHPPNFDSAPAPATARATATRSASDPVPAGPPPIGWRVRALPGAEELHPQGSQSGGGPVRRLLEDRWTLRFDPPPDGATGLELVVDGLDVFRAGPGDVVAVPPPRPDEPVDLAGYSLACGPERVDLVRWEPGPDGTPSLVIAPPPGGSRPDVRVVSGGASVSLWLEQAPGGRLLGGLPPAYAALLGAGEVRLGLRTVGRRVALPPVTFTLAPA